MSDVNSNAPVVPTAVPQADLYGLVISGEQLSPDLPDGSVAVFDSAQVPRAGDIACVWLHDSNAPSVVRLALAVPPSDAWGEELEPVLIANGLTAGSLRSLPMSKVRGVHRFVRIADPEELDYGSDATTEGGVQ